MISGRGGGSGNYSYRWVKYGNREVQVSRMPEDSFNIRITFKHMDEINAPIMKLSFTDAECLWAALGEMAKDLGWSGKMASEMDKGG